MSRIVINGMKIDIDNKLNDSTTRVIRRFGYDNGIFIEYNIEDLDKMMTSELPSTILENSVCCLSSYETIRRRGKKIIIVDNCTTEINEEFPRDVKKLRGNYYSTFCIRLMTEDLDKHTIKFMHDGFNGKETTYELGNMLKVAKTISGDNGISVFDKEFENIKIQVIFGKAKIMKEFNFSSSDDSNRVYDSVWFLFDEAVKEDTGESANKPKRHRNYL